MDDQQGVVYDAAGQPPRAWTRFPGRSRFLCDGRLMMAPQWTVLALNVALTVVVCAVFSGVVIPYMVHNVSAAVAVFFYLLFVLSMSALAATALRDPGVLPRQGALSRAYVIALDATLPAAGNPPAYDAAQYLPRHFATQEGSAPLRTTKEFIVRGITVKNRWCQTCNLYRPPRSSHCSLCDNCVDRFDHHCPWAGNCIGRRNHRFFTVYVTTKALLCIYVFAFSLAHLILIMPPVPSDPATSTRFLDAIRASPLSLVLAIVAFMVTWSVIGLALMHIGLVAKDMTTNEQMKMSLRREDDERPYGDSAGVNCKRMWCGPMMPSFIDRRSRLDHVAADEETGHAGDEKDGDMAIY